MPSPLSSSRIPDPSVLSPPFWAPSALPACSTPVTTELLCCLIPQALSSDLALPPPAGLQTVNSLSLLPPPLDPL